VPEHGAPLGFVFQSGGEESMNARVVQATVADKLLPKQALLAPNDLLPILPRGKSEPAMYRFVRALPEHLKMRVGLHVYVVRDGLVNWLAGEMPKEATARLS